MRVSVQVRGGEGEAAGERWQRSVYLDIFDQERSVFFDDSRRSARPIRRARRSPSIRTILFVVDATNTKPGTSGRIWIKNVALAK